jgi:hypothetical protein
MIEQKLGCAAASREVDAAVFTTRVSCTGEPAKSTIDDLIGNIFGTYFTCVKYSTMRVETVLRTLSALSSFQHSLTVTSVSMACITESACMLWSQRQH